MAFLCVFSLFCRGDFFFFFFGLKKKRYGLNKRTGYCCTQGSGN